MTLFATLGTSSSASSASRKTASSSGNGGQQPPPLPPPPAPEILHHFPSPFQQQRSRIMHQHNLGGSNAAISDARLYNRSLMAGHGEDGLPAPPPLPPVPPSRGPSSYNGVRAGSFASFGHPSNAFGAPVGVPISNGFSHSHYSVPGMFFHQAHPCCSSPYDPALMGGGGAGPHHNHGHGSDAMQNGSSGFVEDHYESASICYGSPAAYYKMANNSASKRGGGGNHYAGGRLAQRPHQRRTSGGSGLRGQQGNF